MRPLHYKRRCGTGGPRTEKSEGGVTRQFHMIYVSINARETNVFDGSGIDDPLELSDSFNERVAGHSWFPLRDTPSHGVQPCRQPADDNLSARDRLADAVELADVFDSLGD